MAQDDIQGQVVDPSGNPVSGAIVELTKSFESNPVEEQTVLRTTTDSNGNYIFEGHPDGDGTTQEWHVSAYNHDGTAYVNSFNNPGVTADLPGNAIPDSAVAHYVASDINANDGDTITTWADSLGSLDLTGGNPTYQTNVLAGEPAVRFGGVDDVLNVSFSSAEAQPNTIFIVGVNRAPNSNNNVFFDGTSDRQVIYWVSGGSSLRWALFADNNNLSGSQDSSANLLTAIFDGGSSVLREDGTQTASGDPGGDSLDGISLGAYADQSEYGEVDILEVVPCNNRLTPAEIDNEEQRLANRYGITI